MGRRKNPNGQSGKIQETVHKVNSLNNFVDAKSLNACRDITPSIIQNQVGLISWQIAAVSMNTLMPDLHTQCNVVLAEL